MDGSLFGTHTAKGQAAARAGRHAEAVEHFRRALAEAPSTEVLEECLGLELALGRHQELIGELRSLVADDPRNESFRFMLMLALYRSRRPAEALEVYRAGGILTVELTELESAIRAGDETLLELEPLASVIPCPRQLPADIADFTGRAAEVTTVAGLLTGDGARVVNLSGKGGAGKSVLAVHVAHEVAEEHFSGGQLYVNLRGTHPRPAAPYDVLGRFLWSLGVPGASIPSREAERAEMYRSLLADRPVLVVLEDAADEAQVVPLLPGFPSSAVIVTSRAPLTGMPRNVPVDVLQPDDAVAMLVRLVGAARVEGEPAAARALAESVGGLPLALRIVGARLAARPHWTLGSMAGLLADEQYRLDELAHGELIVRGSLMLSYDNLNPDAARLLSLLGALNADSISRWMACAAMDAENADGLLDQLVEAQLLDVAGAGRYGLHDLIRIFARERGEPEAQADAVRRVVGASLYLVDQAHPTLYGGDFATIHGEGARWTVPPEYVDQVTADPMDWLETERANLCAAVAQAADAGLDELSWDLAVQLVSLFEVRGLTDDWQRTHEIALRATEAAGNRRGSAALRSSLGTMCISSGHNDLARSHVTLALEAFEEIGDPRGLALACRNMGILVRYSGRDAEARSWYERSLAAFEQVEDVIGQGTLLASMAQIDLNECDHEAAMDRLQRAAAMCAPIGNPRVLAQIKYRLGRLLVVRGEHELADEVLADVVALARAGADYQGETFALRCLGANELRRGRLDAAKQRFDSALALCEKNFDLLGAARARIGLAHVHRSRGDAGYASLLTDDAREVFARYGMTEWRDDPLFAQ